MKISDDWKVVLTKAWSMRFIMLSGVLSGVPTLVALFQGSIPNGPFITLSFIAVVCAGISRVIDQENLK